MVVVVENGKMMHEEVEDWKEILRKGGSLQNVQVDDGRNGWATPSASSFLVRGHNFFQRRVKVAAGDALFKPLAVDWLKSNARLDHVLAHPANRVMQVHRESACGDALKSYFFAINLQVPGRDHYSAVFYFVTDEPIVEGSLLYRFIHEDDNFRNSRFKLINRIVRGPWIVRATVGNHAACLLGRALTCRYIRGANYFEIDVDIGSSAVANAILHLALGYVTSVTIDMAFLIEAQAVDELPEKLLGAVQIAQIEMDSATFVEVQQLRDVPPSNAPLPSYQSGISWCKLGRSLSKQSKSGRKEADTETKGSYWE